jgi:hypothetical protein
VRSSTFDALGALKCRPYLAQFQNKSVVVIVEKPYAERFSVLFDSLPVKPIYYAASPHSFEGRLFGIPDGVVRNFMQQSMACKHNVASKCERSNGLMRRLSIMSTC